MRALKLLAICLVLMVSGCATRWTLFGHSYGGPGQTQGEEQPSASSPPVAPPVADVNEPPHVAMTAPAALPRESLKIKSLKVTFTPAARDQIGLAPQFTESGLVAAVETELRAHKLLDESVPEPSDSIEIVISDFAVRPSTNAVIFGYLLSTGTLNAELEVLAPDGTHLSSSRIQAQSRLIKPAGVSQSDSFEPLYGRFAELAARNLTGAPDPVAVNH